MDLNFWKKDNSHPAEGATDYSYSETVEAPAEVAETLDYHVDPADPEKARFYNNISRWALYVAVVLIPLFFLPWTSNVLNINKQMLLVLVASVGLVSWLLGVVSSGYLAWRNNIVDKGLLVLLGSFIVTTAFSVDKIRSIFGFSSGVSNSLISIVALTVIYFLVVNNTEDEGKTLKSLAGVSIVVALLYGLLQVFGVHLFGFSFSAVKSFNTVGSVNALGILAAVSLPFFSKFRIDLKWLRSAHLEKIGTVLAIVLLVILNWWVLWTVAIAGMVAMIVLENLSGGRFKMNKLILPMTIVVLGVFMMVVNLNLNAFKKDLAVEVAPSFVLSKDVVMSVLKEKPIFGYGPENFSLAFDRYGAGRLANSTLSDARFYDGTSEFVSLAVHGGLVMMVSLAFLLFTAGVMIWRFYKKASVKHDAGLFKEDIGTLATLAALFAALFFYPLNLTLMFFLFVFLGLSALAVFGENKKEFNIEEKTSLSLGSSLGFIGGLILVLVGVYFGATTYISDVKYAQALNEKDNSVSAGLIVEAINWNGNDDRYYRAASQKALQLLSDELKVKASPERDARLQNYITTSISLAKRATEIAPKDAMNWANLGFVYQNLLSLVDGVDKLSEDAYLKGSELRPGDPVFTYRIGMLYLAKFDRYSQLVAARQVNPNSILADAQLSLEKSRDYLKKTTDLSSNFGLAIYNLGVVYERQGEVAEAIQQLEKVAPANNNQPGLAFELGLLYYRAGRKDDAYNALQRAVVLAPDYSNARWYLALLLEERKDLDGAITQLEKILSVDVNKDNEVVIKKLDELRAGKTKTPPGDILDAEPIQ